MQITSCFHGAHFLWMYEVRYMLGAFASCPHCLALKAVQTQRCHSGALLCVRIRQVTDCGPSLYRCYSCSCAAYAHCLLAPPLLDFAASGPG
jgi:hypothetical protein